MNRWINTLGLAVLLAVIMSSSAQAGTYTYFEHTNCANGFQNAFVVTVVDALFGCVLECYGVGCNGARFDIKGTKRPLAGDPGYPYDYEYSGVIDGHLWYTRIQMEPGGTATRAWGMQDDGSYYELVQ